LTLFGVFGRGLYLDSPPTFAAYLLIALGIVVPILIAARLRYVVVLDTLSGPVELFRTGEEKYAKGIATTLNLALARQDSDMDETGLTFYSPSPVRITPHRFRFGEQYKFGERSYRVTDVAAAEQYQLSSRRVHLYKALSWLSLLGILIALVLLHQGLSFPPDDWLDILAVTAALIGLFSSISWALNLIRQGSYTIQIVRLKWAQAKGSSIAFASLDRALVQQVIDAVNNTIAQTQNRTSDFGLGARSAVYDLGHAFRMEGQEFQLGGNIYQLQDIKSISHDIIEFDAGTIRRSYANTAWLIMLALMDTSMRERWSSTLQLAIIAAAIVFFCLATLRPSREAPKVHIIALRGKSDTLAAYASFNGEYVQDVIAKIRKAKKAARGYPAVLHS